jgi:hypothetical protein
MLEILDRAQVDSVVLRALRAVVEYRHEVAEPTMLACSPAAHTALLFALQPHEHLHFLFRRLPEGRHFDGCRLVIDPSIKGFQARHE